jgi:hypothetical protein
MKKIGLFSALLLILPLKIMGITPVHVCSVSIDTSIYDYLGFCSFAPGPFIEWQSNSEMLYGNTFAEAFRKKESINVDIYSFNGQIGTAVVPMLSENTIGLIREIVLSCTMLDDDNEWESIVIYEKQSNNHRFFKAFDHDGTEILADSGHAFYGFDGNNTYIVRFIDNYFGRRFNYDTWRFRTNIASQSPKSLSKTKSTQQSFMQIYGLSDGNYKVSLTPSSGNQVHFQMFDLMGRCVFSKQIENLTKPVSFTVPEGSVPNSPFIAKVKDGNETLYKKQIPVK